MKTIQRIVILGNANNKILNGQLQSIGGAESQLEKLAGELGKCGFQVSLVFPGGEKIALKQSYYNVYSIPSNWARINGIISLLTVLRKIRPHVIIFRGASSLIPIYAAINIFVGAKLFYFSAHDWELSPRKDRLDSWRWQLFRFGLQFCSKILVQNNIQKDGFRNLLLINNHRVNWIKNLPLIDAIDLPSKPGDLFTWIGTYRLHKRPEWLIEIAKQLPEKKFNLILYCWDDLQMESDFRRKIENINNIIFTPGLPRDKLAEVYKKSIAVLITSESEGFPNVAIEAWSQARAVISTQSNVLSKLSKDKGVILADDIDDFVNTIRNTTTREFETVGENGYRFFKSNFSTKRIIEQIRSYF